MLKMYYPYFCMLMNLNVGKVCDGFFPTPSLQTSEVIGKETLPLGNMCPTQFKTSANTLETLVFKS